MKVGYYPGCSLHKVGKEYNKSTYKITEELGVKLEEVKDWNCCGALEVQAVNPLAAKGIVARNLAIAEKQKFEELISACPACSYKLISTNHKMVEDPTHAAEINSLLDTPYYGCLCTRPGDILQFEDPDNPTFMEELIEAMGAEVPYFPMKTKCCGATQLLVAKPTVETLTGNIIVSAKEAGADFIVVACQMCALALDGQQKQSIKRVRGGKFTIPVLYFSQVLGIGMGLDYKSLGLGSNYISPKKLLKPVKT
ncbi:MAG: CoB--CoM heterodisulfide reductase iron-sulfur subunit B family protein [Candidatus Hodarchaeales archaeon]|jgi:heterodisulfide reductase subunit B